MRKPSRPNDIRAILARFTLVVPAISALIILPILTKTPSVAAETLREAWMIDVSVDQTIEANRWEAAAARERYCAARAEQMPKISGSASYRVIDNPLTVKAQLPPNPLMPQGLTLPMQILQQDILVSSVDLTQPLYTFGRIQNQISAAAQNARAERHDLRTTELDVRLQVAQAYINILNAQRAIEVANISILSLKKHQRDVKNLLKQGVVVRNDYLAVEVSLAKAQQSKIYAENLLNLTRASYNRFLRRPLDSPVDIEDLPKPTGTYNLEFLTQQAITSADENFTVAANRYRQGAGTNTEVLDAERLRTETYSNFYTSRYSTVLSLMKLNRAIGDFSLLDNLYSSTQPLPTTSQSAPLPPKLSQASISLLPKTENQKSKTLR